MQNGLKHRKWNKIPTKYLEKVIFTSTPAVTDIPEYFPQHDHIFTRFLLHTTPMKMCYDFNTSLTDI